jgi:quercetin dioxygenase-like cupin family protein
MKHLLAALLAGAVIFAGTASMVSAEDQHTVVPAQEIKWGPPPPGLPPGAEAVVLYGDPTREGLFAMRLKVPDGYRVPPHTHPQPEVVTVISGTFRLGMGETADASKAQALPAGSFFALSPGMAHYAFFEGETVTQITTNGPWDIRYVDPKDDPRQSQ